ncbi:hypothetical protein PBT90_05315 [Algoriphagus halophytocola]|uniref:Lipoprotein n=1 Tax=Algoriphagus halophytocola TaxID=2991499 RepID=A0ABY6MGC5_9BACT|nr:MULTISPECIES: hypothetical protein [unclassified Algoriphagus]UZD22836.1 hypothetical protein OM944_19575 [Algoriphagus sp. TR-M5]WBL44103.1 hypothetical protein PBT90_05315 [Algoriphagus sp. TR-M9]
MKKIIFYGLLLLSVPSCSMDDEDFIRTETGEIWLSGGLNHCAHQIRLDTGDTLVVDLKDLSDYITGDRVSVKYKELGLNEFCSPKIDCSIIEISKLD